MPRPRKTETKEATEKALKTLTDGQRLERLEKVVAKFAHYNGNEAILREYGIEPWIPGKEDMEKYKDGK